MMRCAAVISDERVNDNYDDGNDDCNKKFCV